MIGTITHAGCCGCFDAQTSGEPNQRHQDEEEVSNERLCQHVSHLSCRKDGSMPQRMIMCCCVLGLDNRSIMEARHSDSSMCLMESAQAGSERVPCLVYRLFDSLTERRRRPVRLLYAGRPEAEALHPALPRLRLALRPPPHVVPVAAQAVQDPIQSLCAGAGFASYLSVAT